MDSFNLELLKRNSATKRKPEVMKPLPRHGQGEKFLKGPIPWNWINAAARISGKGKALHVAIACWYLAGIKLNATIKLSTSVLRDMGVDRHAYYRGLNQLEKAGLVSANKKRGRLAIVTLL